MSSESNALPIDPGVRNFHRELEIIDIHWDTPSMAHIFGLPLEENLSQQWKPTRNRWLFQTMKCILPRGKNAPQYNHGDLPRMRMAPYSGACWTAHAILNNISPLLQDGWKEVQAHYQSFRRLEEDSKNALQFVTTLNEYEEARAQGKHAVMFTVEGAHVLGSRLSSRERRLGRLRKLREEMGAVLITLNH